MTRHAMLRLMTVMLLLSMLSGCLVNDPIVPPSADYLGPNIGSGEQTIVSEISESGVTVPTETAEPAPSETEGSTSDELPLSSASDEETSTSSQQPSNLPSESLPDPRETPPSSGNLDLGVYSSTVVGFSYPPVQDVIDTLAKYNTYAYGPTDSRTIYLSLNAGYEYNNGMSRILDILASYDIKATIFIDGAFIRTQNELTRRIAAEGYLVGNHTMGHIDLAELAAAGRYDEARQELSAFEELYREISGKEAAKIFRPPSSSWSERSLELVRRAGFKTYLFSFTHKDWEVDHQPDPGQALTNLKQQVFPGSLVMLHTVSETNVQILEDFIIYAHDAGYNFGLLPTG